MKTWPFKKRVILWIAPKILKWWITFVYWTCKIEWIGEEYIQEQQEQGGNWIFALWHMNTALCSYPMKQYKPVAMSSNSFDGEVSARTLEGFGFSTSRGSSSDMGARAMTGMIRLLKKGRNGTITPDGPRGPAYQVSIGTVAIAQKTGLPVLPCHAMSTKPLVFEKSWDKHVLPKLFGHVILHVGKPFHVPKGLSKEELEQTALDLRDQLNENKEQCELAMAKLLKPEII